MKILLSHRYFWPDTPPYAYMLRSIARRLADDGHQVTVFSTMPSYRDGSDLSAPETEQVDGIAIIRMAIAPETKGNLLRRASNLISYSRGLSQHIRQNPDYEAVMAATFPPIAAGLAGSRAARKIGAKFIYHCQDIHPEVSKYSGRKIPGFLWRWLQALDNRACKFADAVIVLSQDMRDTLNARSGGEQIKTHIINNFLVEDFDAPAEEAPIELLADKFTILFAGNIGNFQNLDLVMEAVRLLEDQPDIQFWFVGEGAAKARLVAGLDDLQEKTVFFVPRQPAAVAQKMMASASLNLVSLSKGVYHVSYPSKTLTSLALSTPILAVMEENSELGKMVREENIGYTAGPNLPSELASVIRVAYSERTRRTELRANVKRLYERRFATEKILENWSQLFVQLDTGK